MLTLRDRTVVAIIFSAANFLCCHWQDLSCWPMFPWKGKGKGKKGKNKQGKGNAHTDASKTDLATKAPEDSESAAQIESRESMGLLKQCLCWFACMWSMDICQGWKRR